MISEIYGNTYPASALAAAYSNVSKQRNNSFFSDTLASMLSGVSASQQTAGTEDVSNFLTAIKPEDIAGEKLVYAWGHIQTGSRIKAYLPEDFDENNPVYHVIIHDAQGNTIERMVNISELDTTSCDIIDMMTYANHLTRTGEYEKANDYFATLNQYHTSSIDGFSHESLFVTENWSEVTKDIVQMLYERASDDTGFYTHYLQCKEFLDFLEQN